MLTGIMKSRHSLPTTEAARARTQSIALNTIGEATVQFCVWNGQLDLVANAAFQVTGATRQ